jgi:hypothetical protein
MDFLKPYLNWQVAVGLLFFGLAAYFIYRWYMSEKSGFLDLGEACNPELENACGKNAKCQADESGKKGVCFPKEEEHEEGAENVASE